MQLVRMVESHASLHRDVFFFFHFVLRSDTHILENTDYLGNMVFPFC
jgi:hypothetical protein